MTETWDDFIASATAERDWLTFTLDRQAYSDFDACKAALQEAAQKEADKLAKPETERLTAELSDLADRLAGTQRTVEIVQMDDQAWRDFKGDRTLPPDEQRKRHNRGEKWFTVDPDKFFPALLAEISTDDDLTVERCERMFPVMHHRNAEDIRERLWGLHEGELGDPKEARAIADLLTSVSRRTPQQSEG